jgi:hypothetical protein
MFQLEQFFWWILPRNTLASKRLDLCKENRLPSDDRWNWLSRKLYCKFAEKMALTPFRYLFLYLKTCLGGRFLFRGRVLELNPVSAKYGRWLSFKPSDEICVLSFDILHFYYLSNANMHGILKFEYLHATYSLAVKYMNSKHESRLVIIYVYRR